MFKLLLLTFFTLNLFANEPVISPQMQKIFELLLQDGRIDLKDEILSLQNPYPKIQEAPAESSTETDSSTPPQKKEEKLTMILDGAAKIGATWYKVGDEYNGQKIVEITDNKVILQKLDSTEEMLLIEKNINLEVKTNETRN